MMVNVISIVLKISRIYLRNRLSEDDSGGKEKFCPSLPNHRRLEKIKLDKLQDVRNLYYVHMTPTGTNRRVQLLQISQLSILERNLG